MMWWVGLPDQPPYLPTFPSSSQSTAFSLHPQRSCLSLNKAFLQKPTASISLRYFIKPRNHD